LWIDKKWISGGPGDHNTVLNGQIILGETLQGPLTDNSIIDEEFHNIQASCDWNTSLFHITCETLTDQNLTELSVEGTAVRQESAAQ
jgi:hypothetical protein